MVWVFEACGFDRVLAVGFWSGILGFGLWGGLVLFFERGKGGWMGVVRLCLCFGG